MTPSPTLVLVGAVALAVASPRPAAAGGAKTLLASFFNVDETKIKSASGYRVTGVAAYTHIAIGSYQDTGGREQRIVALAKCDDHRCTGQRVWLGAFESHLHGIVDLAGKPGPLRGTEVRASRDDWTTSLPLPAKRTKFPALVIEIRDEEPGEGTTRFGGTYSGTERHHHLLVVSLRKADEKVPTVARLSTEDTYPAGGGTSTSYRLEKGKQRALDIVGSEQRHLQKDSRCRRPEPVEVRYVLKDGRYEHFDAMLGRSGCH